MQISTIVKVCLAAAGLSFAQSPPLMVPVPWYITDLSISNIRHGSGGTWSFNILDAPTVAPQGFNTSCRYYNPTTYIFAIDGAPINQPCNDPSVTFSLYPSANGFTFNVTHLWGNCGTVDAPQACNDNGTWTFSTDDVRGQEVDVQNNFGQSGYFSRSSIAMYPKRAVPSEKCEFC